MCGVAGVFRTEGGAPAEARVPEAFGLDRLAFTSTVETATPQWLTRLLLLEIWGQLFVDGRREEDLREGIMRTARRR